MNEHTPQQDHSVAATSPTFMERHILPMLSPILIGFGSAAIATVISTARLDERVTSLEKKWTDHTGETVALRARDNEYERRISRVETSTENVVRNLDEIKGDIKAILKAERIK